MTTDNDIKQQVREFYDQVGWQEVGEGVYQNARYEDLRPVSRDYIHRCHLRVKRHLASKGRYFLDAGSGPIQYPEYLTYSEGYEFRVCADISIQALMEARKRIGNHGLYVVADVANLPFAPEVFEGAVSLHTIHHLPIREHLQAYRELYRVMKPASVAVIVNGWFNPPLGEILDGFGKWVLRVRGFVNHRLLKRDVNVAEINPVGAQQKKGERKSTFVDKNHPSWFKAEIASRFPMEIRVWRSVSVKQMRIFIQEKWGGRFLLRLLYWLEERFPHWFGVNGQYPLIILRKPGTFSR